MLKKLRFPSPPLLVFYVKRRSIAFAAVAVYFSTKIPFYPPPPTRKKKEKQEKTRDSATPPPKNTHPVGLHGPQQPQRLHRISSLCAGVNGARVAVAVGLETLPLHLTDKLARLFPLDPDNGKPPITDYTFYKKENENENET